MAFERFCRGAGRGGRSYWFGSMGAVEAVAVAWALSNRDQTVRSCSSCRSPAPASCVRHWIQRAVLIAGQIPHEGMVTPFGGMLAGYLFGAGNPTPARRLLLKLRYLWIARRAAKYRARSRVCESSKAATRRTPPQAAHRQAISELGIHREVGVRERKTDVA